MMQVSGSNYAAAPHKLCYLSSSSDNYPYKSGFLAYIARLQCSHSFKQQPSPGVIHDPLSRVIYKCSKCALCRHITCILIKPGRRESWHSPGNSSATCIALLQLPLLVGRRFQATKRCIHRGNIIFTCTCMQRISQEKQEVRICGQVAHF